MDESLSELYKLSKDVNGGKSKVGCCCSEIRKYSDKLSKLKSAKSMINSAVYNCQITNDYMVKSGEQLKNEIILNQAEIFIEQELSDGYKYAILKINDAYDEVSRAIEMILEKLEAYIKQDNQWHRHEHEK